MSIKKVLVLGSTGSIGINTLRVVERFPDQFKIVGLSALNNVDLLAEQIRQFSPKCVAVGSEHIKRLRSRIGRRPLKIFDANTEIENLVRLNNFDIIVLGIQGSVALKPFLMAVRLGKRIAPANKEALVMAGPMIMQDARRHKACIIPVDSEQSAIFQCLQGHNRDEVKKVYLTASGGPLRDVKKNRFDKVSLEEILDHPRWKMGKKITVDSATLMNKGLEIIEAMWLFDLKVHEIEVAIHPESIVHSMVEFCDGSVLAQLGVTDMRIPIQYALTYPKRMETKLPAMDFFKQKQLTFLKPDFKKFPALALCYEVARKGKTFGSVLNAANEEAVEAFLKGKICFSRITQIVEKVVLWHKPLKALTMEEILQADRWAREKARGLIGA
ncbi:MAG: 1-deoxy-D-xylulose-5-phosphate reductoisomerase [Candidatus Omnitrophota bacterium]